MDGKEKPTILIVDDERSNIDILMYILKPLYTILVAKNGMQAIDTATDSLPDLILMDVIMPDLSGFEVLAALKESDLTRGIPVIFITGQNNVHDEERGFFLGAVDYITKPFHDSIVKARVKTHLQIVKHARTIEQMGMIDALTDIPNRRGFDKQLTLEWRRAAREKMPISMLMIDIDKFKNFNDLYGHPCGDAVLQTVAQIFKNTLRRTTDFVARWGGEEFVVLLANTNTCGALEVAEQIRENVEKAEFLTPSGKNTKITVSIGVNTEMPASNEVSGDFLSGADVALYTAKNTGRNRVCSH